MISAMKKFHERLREARKAAGFSSQEKFAEHIGMIRTQYLLYETGDKLPDMETTLPKIADGLGLPISTLKAWHRMDGSTEEEIAVILRDLVGEKRFLALIEAEMKDRGLLKGQ